MSNVVELLMKEASELRSEVAAQEEWTAVKQAAVDALILQGFKRETAEEVLRKLESQV